MYRTTTLRHDQSTPDFWPEPCSPSRPSTGASLVPEYPISEFSKTNFFPVTSAAAVSGRADSRRTGKTSFVPCDFEADTRGIIYYRHRRTRPLINRGRRPRTIPNGPPNWHTPRTIIVRRAHACSGGGAINGRSESTCTPHVGNAVIIITVMVGFVIFRRRRHDVLHLITRCVRRVRVGSAGRGETAHATGANGFTTRGHVGREPEGPTKRPETKTFCRPNDP